MGHVFRFGGGVDEVLFQVLGPTGGKYKYRAPKADGSGRYTDYIERVELLKAENACRRAWWSKLR